MAKPNENDVAEKPGLLASMAGAVKDGWDNFKIGDEITLKSVIDHGRTELAAGLMGGHDGHVMYMKGDATAQAQQQAEDKPLTLDDLKAAGQAKAAEAEKEQPAPEKGMEQSREMEM